MPHRRGGVPAGRVRAMYGRRAGSVRPASRSPAADSTSTDPIGLEPTLAGTAHRPAPAIGRPRRSARRRIEELVRTLAVVLALSAFLIGTPPAAAASAPASPAGEHWLRLSRSAHAVWAMVDDRPVYQAPATFGKPGY